MFQPHYTQHVTKTGTIRRNAVSTYLGELRHDSSANIPDRSVGGDVDGQREATTHRGCFGRGCDCHLNHLSGFWDNEGEGLSCGRWNASREKSSASLASIANT